MFNLKSIKNMYYVQLNGFSFGIIMNSLLNLFYIEFGIEIFMKIVYLEM